MVKSFKQKRSTETIDLVRNEAKARGMSSVRADYQQNSDLRRSPQVLVPDKTFGRLLRNLRRHTFFGEEHQDESMIGFLTKLLASQRFNALYLEALLRGNYAVEGDKLKAGGPYCWNPEKYDELVSIAIANNVEVHGIDSKRRATESQETGFWANYILETGSANQNLILIGANHVNYWTKKDTTSEVLPSHLFGKGIPKRDILTISGGSECFMSSPEPNLYTQKRALKRLGYDHKEWHHIADYLFVHMPYKDGIMFMEYC